MGKTGPLHAYPAQLAAFVLAQAKERGLAVPEGDRAQNTLTSLLSVAYQASLLRDEDRQLTFRIALCGSDAFAEAEGPPSGTHKLLFGAPRPFEVHELRKLVPAVKFQRSLVGVESHEGTLRIWGIAHTGPRWLRFAQGGRGAASDLPDGTLVVHVNGPGDLVVSAAGFTLGRLFAGELTTPMLDVFDAEWLPHIFGPIKDELFALHEQARANATEPWAPIEYRAVGHVGQNLIRRIIATIRTAKHGGAVLVVPPSRVEEMTERGMLDIKYRFADHEPRRRYRTLILRIMSELARLGASSASKLGDWALYEQTDSPAISLLDEAVFELAHLIAGLSDVDGMVVMTQRFEVLGFGGVVSGHLADVQRVFQAIDVEGNTRIEESPDGVGTRHRAAYRICAAMPEALAIVVSQDGSVRFVRDLGGSITYWDQVIASVFGG